jgi:hypothetical protein
MPMFNTYIKTINNTTMKYLFDSRTIEFQPLSYEVLFGHQAMLQAFCIFGPRRVLNDLAGFVQPQVNAVPEECYAP